jgi:DnaJ like chaperone protein
MNWAGKIIGMVFGFLLGGPIGLLMGLFIGHILDQNWLRRLFVSVSLQRTRVPKIQQIFFNNTFRVMGNIAKADGRVSENEIRQARQIMQQMGLDENLKREAIRLFGEGKEPQFNLRAALMQVKEVCAFQPTLLRIFLEMQIQVAFADGGNISQPKREILLNICQQLGVSSVHFNQFEQRYRAEQNYQRYQQQPRPDPYAQLNNAYQVLGLPRSANDAEIKKAYRRLMSRHHPDKLMAKGLPPEMIKMATQKTQQIKSAYEQICKARKVHA